MKSSSNSHHNITHLLISDASLNSPNLKLKKGKPKSIYNGIRQNELDSKLSFNTSMNLSHVKTIYTNGIRLNELDSKLSLTTSMNLSHTDRVFAPKSGGKQRILAKKSNFNHSELKKIRQKVLTGDFMYGSTDFKGKKSAALNLWQFRQWQLIVFISSTFTDTRKERNILLYRILPELKKIASASSINITFVDMRWGVRDEETIDHKTWIECQRQITRCRDESCGLFFLSLQSEKYGYRPLPRSIEVDIFDRHTCEPPRWNLEIKELSDQWYNLDINSNPHKYVLKKLEWQELEVPNEQDSSKPKIVKKISPEYFRDILPRLRFNLNGLRFCKHLCRDIMVGRSISEWEVKYALMNDDDIHRAFWIHREFKGQFSDISYCDTSFDNEVSKEAKVYLRDLKEWMTRRFNAQCPNRIQSYVGTIAYEDYVSGLTPACESYEQQWTKNTSMILHEELASVMESQVHWNRDSWGMGIPGHYMEIFLHHAKIAHQKCIYFYGRHDLIVQSMQLFKRGNRIGLNERLLTSLTSGSSDSKSFLGIYACISFMVIGHSGTGKSAFMAKLAQHLFEEDASQEERQGGKYRARPVFIRFCGTSDDSIYSDDILRSLRVQMEYVLGPAPSTSKGAAECSERDLFKALVKHHAVIILLDDIEEIVDGIEFLRNIELHPETRIIISTTIGNTALVDALLSADSVPAFEVPLFAVPDHNEKSEVKDYIQNLLSKKQRTLTDVQWVYILSKVRESPSALYIYLAVYLSSKWTSDINTPFLENSADGVFSQILDDIEISHGSKFARTALGLITFSVRGLSDTEIEDMVSYDEGVLYEVFQYDFPLDFRLPSHVWSKLRNKVSEFLVEQQHGCVSWCHEDFKRVALARYSKDADEKNILVTTLARYFTNDKPALKNILIQPLFWPSFEGMDSSIIWYPEGDRYVNLRRLFEASEHLLKCGAEYYELAVQELCSLEFVCAAVKCNNYSILIPRLQNLLELLISSQSSQELQNRVEDYLDWLKPIIFDITRYPALQITVSASQQPLDSCVREDYIELIDKHKKNHSTIFTKRSWIRGKTLHFEDGHGLKLSKNKVSWCADSARIVGILGGNQFRIWNTAGDRMETSTVEPIDKKNAVITGVQWGSNPNQIWLLNVPTLSLWSVNEGVLTSSISEENILGFAVSCNDQFIATYCIEPHVCIYDSVSGELVNKISFHSTKNERHYLYSITCVEWRPDNKFIVIGFVNGNVLVYDMMTTVGASPKLSLTNHTKSIRSVAWSQDCTKIASTSEDTEVVVVNSGNGSLVGKLSSHQRTVDCICWCYDSVHTASGSSDGVIYIWSSLTKTILCSLVGHSSGVRSIAWSPNKLYIVSSDDDNTVILWDSIAIDKY